MPNSQGHWDTTVTELLTVFRDALVALVPIADRAHIAWRNAEAYDDWDNIAEALYRNIVIRSLEFGLKQGEALNVPDYGLIYPNYADKSFFEITNPKLGGARYNVFVAFGSSSQPFDTVLYVPTTGPDLAPCTNMLSMGADGASFRFLWRRDRSELDGVTRVTIEL